MTADAHRELRELLGSYTVGALAPDERARVLAHLDGCRDCRELLAELEPVAAALSAVHPAQLSADPPAPARVEPLLAQVSDELGQRRRRRARIGAAAAAVAAALLLALAVVRGGEPAGPPPPEQRRLLSVAPGVSGTVALLDRFWGTQLTLEARGLPDQRRVVIWMQRRDGRRVPAGTLNGLGATLLKAQLAAGVRVDDARAVGISDASGTILLSARVQG